MTDQPNTEQPKDDSSANATMFLIGMRSQALKLAVEHGGPGAIARAELYLNWVLLGSEFVPEAGGTTVSATSSGVGLNAEPPPNLTSRPPPIPDDDPPRTHGRGRKAGAEPMDFHVAPECKETLGDADYDDDPPPFDPDPPKVANIGIVDPLTTSHIEQPPPNPPEADHGYAKVEGVFPMTFEVAEVAPSPSYEVEAGDKIKVVVDDGYAPTPPDVALDDEIKPDAAEEQDTTEGYPSPTVEQTVPTGGAGHDPSTDAGGWRRPQVEIVRPPMPPAPKKAPWRF